MISSETDKQVKRTVKMARHIFVFACMALIFSAVSDCLCLNDNSNSTNAVIFSFSLSNRLPLLPEGRHGVLRLHLHLADFHGVHHLHPADYHGVHHLLPVVCHGFHHPTVCRGVHHLHPVGVHHLHPAGAHHHHLHLLRLQRVHRQCHHPLPGHPALQPHQNQLSTSTNHRHKFVPFSSSSKLAVWM